VKKSLRIFQSYHKTKSGLFFKGLDITRNTDFKMEWKKTMLYI